MTTTDDAINAILIFGIIMLAVGIFVYATGGVSPNV